MRVVEWSSPWAGARPAHDQAAAASGIADRETGRTMEIGFDRPPINEVVVSMFFDPPLEGFRSEHVGRFWEKIREEFPSVQQQIPFARGFGPAIGPDEVIPMPRYWFISADDANVIQIQKEAFIYNWRRRGDNLYPGFMSSIEPSFRRLYKVFESFLTADLTLPEPTIIACELTYVDIIEAGEYWTGLEDTSKVIPSFFSLAIDSENAKRSGFNYAQGYDVEDGTHLSIGIISAVGQSDPERRALRLEFKAEGQFNGVQKHETDGWWKRAHDEIARCFVGVTSVDVQYELWGRRA